MRATSHPARDSRATMRSLLRARSSRSGAIGSCDLVEEEDAHQRRRQRLRAITTARRPEARRTSEPVG